ncbi:hypothetical protein BpHYR1_037847 [Brachionus plicatilis]|uniref:Uncharacterized protein n=1 Tax=Brachionus plicatilis TaxID=10195 RepID=A0A3M7RRL2_BRAPC|nr:hypothetical protein BpHYR1_037847 [Brachionus plicatilis]
MATTMPTITKLEEFLSFSGTLIRSKSLNLLCLLTHVPPFWPTSIICWDTISMGTESICAKTAPDAPPTKAVRSYCQKAFIFDDCFQGVKGSGVQRAPGLNLETCAD